MTQLTSPDNIAKWTLQDPGSFVQASQTQGDSVQAALSKRERYDFVWANSSELTSQTGMVQGSRGYQIDTKSEYIYDNSNWRLSMSHAEFDASKTMADGFQQPITVGTFSIVSEYTNNTTFIVPAGDGILRIVDPGMYAISTVTQLRTTDDLAVAPATGRSFLDIAYTENVADIQRVSIATGEDRGSLAVPNIRTTTSNKLIYIEVLKVTGGNALVKTRVRITRLG